MAATPAERRAAEAGYAVFTPRTLAFYDLVVHGLSNHLAWRCPTRYLVAHYERHVSANHLDVGVGTGLLLDRCRFPARSPRLALLDANPHCLAAAARRLARHRPEVHRADVLAPLRLGVPPFDSIGLSYVLHCLPGPMPAKAAALDHLLPLLKPGGVLFGATLLGRGVPRGRLARHLMAAYNARGFFANAEDDPEGLRTALRERFPESAVRVIGCAALFAARTKRAG
ncbi:MAG TPA: class I SAM-dependent methyltransferase [Geminicoccaceae bacterium]|nr:class I SAM-dependent methyltransferase [Geminicoccaceae bacterium]